MSRAEGGCTVYAPVQKPRDPRVDRHAPHAQDSEKVAQWRQRMGTEEAKAIYKERAAAAAAVAAAAAAAAECVNALSRGRGLLQFVVRGVKKVRSIALWHALAHNVLRIGQLRASVLVGVSE